MHWPYFSVIQCKLVFIFKYFEHLINQEIYEYMCSLKFMVMCHLCMYVCMRVQIYNNKV